MTTLLLRCPCGDPRPPVTWRAGASNRYRLRCLRCGLMPKTAATLNEPDRLEQLWNATVAEFGDAPE